MTKMLKRLERIINNPKDVKWNEMVSLLKFLGFVCEKPSRGSHWSVYHPDSEEIIIVPVHQNRVKPVYIKKLLR